MHLSKSALRKARRYNRQKYFAYLDALLQNEDLRGLAKEVARNLDSRRAISIYEYVRDRRRDEGRVLNAEAALYVWTNQVQLLVPCPEQLRRPDDRPQRCWSQGPSVDTSGLANVRDERSHADQGPGMQSYPSRVGAIT